MLSTWSSDLNINLKNGEGDYDGDVGGMDSVGNDDQDDFDDQFDNGNVSVQPSRLSLTGLVIAVCIDYQPGHSFIFQRKIYSRPSNGRGDGYGSNT